MKNIVVYTEEYLKKLKLSQKLEIVMSLVHGSIIFKSDQIFHLHFV